MYSARRDAGVWSVLRILIGIDDHVSVDLMKICPPHAAGAVWSPGESSKWSAAWWPSPQARRRVPRRRWSSLRLLLSSLRDGCRDVGFTKTARLYQVVLTPPKRFEENRSLV